MKKFTWSKFSHSLQDALIAHDLPGLDLRIALFVFRLTRGRQDGQVEERVQVGYSELCEATGAPRATLRRSLKRLVDNRVLVREVDGQGGMTSTYSLNLDCKDWQYNMVGSPLRVLKNEHTPVPTDEHTPVLKSEHTPVLTDEHTPVLKNEHTLCSRMSTQCAQKRAHPVTKMSTPPGRNPARRKGSRKSISSTESENIQRPTGAVRDIRESFPFENRDPSTWTDEERQQYFDSLPPWGFRWSTAPSADADRGGQTPSQPSQPDRKDQAR